MGARVAVSVERANKASFFIGPSRKGEAGLRRAMGSDLTAGTGWASGRTELLCFFSSAALCTGVRRRWGDTERDPVETLLSCRLG